MYRNQVYNPSIDNYPLSHEKVKQNPLNLLQKDGTYKLIWIPDKQRGWCLQVHGTSNLVN